MKDSVTHEQIESYQENGFLIVNDFLDAAELEKWRTVTDEAVAQRLEAVQNKENAAKLHEKGTWDNQADPSSFYAKVFTQCVKLAETHEGMRELMLDERLGRIAADLAKVDGIRIWHDQALIKPPFGNATGWHLDNPYWSFSSRDSISIWVALDDATLENGCMYYIPGSQKEASWNKNSGISTNASQLFELYPEWRKIKSVGCPCKAGSAVFHNGLTAHGAGSNMTNGQRRAMTCAYMPVGSTFNGETNVLPQWYTANLKVGDVLDNDEANPLIFSRN